jgi:2-polyprenyl-6-methoxyphenol hydroxylase-like FAD-dependent oxidoreductase
MQFHHAHAFRHQVGMALRKEWPAAFEAWLEAGAEPVLFDVPGMGPVPAGHRSRRETFERALRTTADSVPGLTLLQGHVDGLVTTDGRVHGLVVDGRPVEADLVVDASGRAGRSTDEVRAPVTTGGP